MSTTQDSVREALAALKAARQFIVNGIEFGYIRMPDADTPDTAHDTLPTIEAAIAALSTPPAPRAPSIEPVGEAEIVGDTRFEGWLSEHEITDVRGSKLPMYHKQDMREAYWAGYKERASLAAPASAGVEPTQAREAEPASAKQIKLRELADRIDHEKLWSRPALEHRDWPQENRDRMDAGVALRRYSDLLEPNRWLIFPPSGPVQFSAVTLDDAVRMAKKEEARRAASTSPKGST